MGSDYHQDLRDGVEALPTAIEAALISERPSLIDAVPALRRDVLVAVLWVNPERGRASLKRLVRQGKRSASIAA